MATARRRIRLKGRKHGTARRRIQLIDNLG